MDIQSLKFYTLYINKVVDNTVERVEITIMNMQGYRTNQDFGSNLNFHWQWKD